MLNVHAEFHLLASEKPVTDRRTGRHRETPETDRGTL